MNAFLSVGRQGLSMVGGVLFGFAIMSGVCGQEPPLRLTLKSNTESRLCCVVFRDDGTLLTYHAVVFKPGIAYQWDVTSGKVKSTHPYKEHHAIMPSAFGPDGKIWAFPEGRLVVLVDTLDGTKKATLVESDSGIRCLAINSEGKVAVGRNDHTIKVWEFADGKEGMILKGHKEGLVGVGFSGDGKLLASGDRTGEVKLWDVASGKEKANFKDMRGTSVRSLAISNDGKLLAVGFWGTLRFWDLTTRKEKASIELDGDPVSVSIQELVFSKDGKFLASVDLSRRVKLWDVDQAKVAFVFRSLGGSGPVNSVAFSKDGKRFACPTVIDNRAAVEIFDLAGPRKADK